MIEGEYRKQENIINYIKLPDKYKQKAFPKISPVR